MSEKLSEEARGESSPPGRSEETQPEAAQSTSSRSVSREVVAAVLAEFQFGQFSGPLPPPEMLSRYNETLPGAADRIVSMAERQSSHRQSLEAQTVRNNAWAQKAGVVVAGWLGTLGVGGGVYLAATDHSLAGLGAIITAVAGLAGVFLVGRKRQGEQLDRRRELSEQPVPRAPEDTGKALHGRDPRPE